MKIVEAMGAFIGEHAKAGPFIDGAGLAGSKTRIRLVFANGQGSVQRGPLRGRHELQILGDFKSGEATLTGNGSIYNFKAPDKFVTKPAGEWQTVEASIIGHRITVILNGVRIHDNVECTKATGSELDDKINEPGSIFLQGDHGTVSFRNIRIKEIK